MTILFLNDAQNTTIAMTQCQTSECLENALRTLQDMGVNDFKFEYPYFDKRFEVQLPIRVTVNLPSLLNHWKDMQAFARYFVKLVNNFKPELTKYNYHDLEWRRLYFNVDRDISASIDLDPSILIRACQKFAHRYPGFRVFASLDKHVEGKGIYPVVFNALVLPARIRTAKEDLYREIFASVFRGQYPTDKEVKQALGQYTDR